MHDYTLEDLQVDTEIKLVFEYHWFPKLVSICRSMGLNCIRMAAHAIALSEGDARKREIDWDYLEEYMGADNPLFAIYYEDNGQPSRHVIDLATRWGLFQVHGRLAQSWGWSGRAINLIDATKNIQVACKMVADGIHVLETRIKTLEQKGDPESLREAARIQANYQEIAESCLGSDMARVREEIANIARQVAALQDLGTI